MTLNPDLEDALSFKIKYYSKGRKSLRWIGWNDPAYLDLLIDRVDPNRTTIFNNIVLANTYYEERIGKAASLRFLAIKKKVCKIKGNPRKALIGSTNEPIMALGDRVPFETVKQAAKENELDVNKLKEAVASGKKYGGKFWVSYTDGLADVFCKYIGPLTWNIIEESKLKKGKI